MDSEEFERNVVWFILGTTILTAILGGLAALIA